MLGLMRWSYLGLRGYQQDHATIAQRRAFLYEPARLERRWRWFEHVALPAWRAQTDPDFTLVLMTGPDLPEPYLSRLERLVAEIPQLRLALVPPMERHLEACAAAIQPHRDPAADVIGHFRHDDDDAVSYDYIQSARTDFGLVDKLWLAERRLSLDHAKGIIGRVTPAGLHLAPRMCHNMGVALTVFLPAEHKATALHFNHARIGQWMPGVSMTHRPMFLRLIHADADSGAEGLGYAWDTGPERLETLVARRFGVDAGLLDKAAREMALPSRG